MDASTQVLKVTTITKIYKLFDRKKWHTIDEGSMEEPRTFDQFCNLLSMLSEEEQDLIIQLTEDFDCFAFFDYEGLFLEAFKKIDKKLLLSHQNIYLVPLTSPKDIIAGNLKSGSAIVYTVKSLVIDKFIDRNKQSVIGVADILKLNQSFSKRKNSFVIFLDDFIGTGDTAISALNEYKIPNGLKESSLIVCAVGLEQGIDTIRRTGFEVVSARIKKKGISESDRINNKQKALQLMGRIEKRLKIKELFRLGYKQSEALIKMIRTPNNTFPVYWCREMKDGNEWPAPFPRN